MRRRHALAAVLFVGTMTTLAGCGIVVPPIGGPDRTDTVEVSGGECEVSWWLGPLAEGIPDAARRVAKKALASARVSSAERAEWRSILADDPDVTWRSEAKLEGSAYREVVRAHVREALDEAGYPDTNRVIEVYSDLHCTA